jgi:methyl-accepting chemotaxis protein
VTEVHDRGGLVRRVGLRLRLSAAFAALMLLMAAMAVIGAVRLSELEGRITDTASVSMRGDRVVGEWLSMTRANGVRAIVLTHSEDPALARLLRPEFEATTRNINELQRQVEQLVTTAAGKALLATIAEKRSAYLAVRKAVLAKKGEGDAAGASQLLESGMLPAMNNYVQAIGALGDFYARAVAHDSEAAVQSAAAGRRLLVGCCAMGLLLSLLGAWLITRSVAQPVGAAMEAARKVAQGDLTVRIVADGRDELGQLLQALADMVNRLRALVGEVASTARSVAEASRQIAQGNADLSQRTEEQASTLEETASSMEELTSTVTQNAEHARVATQVAAGASQVAREGGEVMGAVVQTMTGISESSRKVAEIVGVIDSIAFQTNILALNAAVEAARAGDQGRGFAVVASEVRNLAQRSAAAAKEIKGLISESVGQVESGSRLVDTAGTKMKHIVDEFDKVSGLVTEIAQASQEQTCGIEQVNVAITQMDQGVQQNASLVEEAAAATESMKGEASALLELVGRFRIGEDAALPAAVQDPAPRKPARAWPNELRGGTSADALPQLRQPLPAMSGAWREF